MRRVYVIYWFRRLHSSSTFYKAVGFFGLVGINLTIISTPDVLNNVSRINGVTAIGRYLIGSFLKSELAAQSALVACGLITVVVLRDIFGVVREKARFPLAFHFK